MNETQFLSFKPDRSGNLKQDQGGEKQLEGTKAKYEDIPKVGDVLRKNILSEILEKAKHGVFSAEDISSYRQRLLPEIVERLKTAGYDEYVELGEWLGGRAIVFKKTKQNLQEGGYEVVNRANLDSIISLRARNAGSSNVEEVDTGILNQIFMSHESKLKIKGFKKSKPRSAQNIN